MSDRSEQRDQDSPGADGHRWNGVQTLVATWPDFDNYRHEPDRDIPVVVLERR